MAGICGGGTEPAESIVLSGGYEDDEDHGDVIIYTGHGGNDPQTKKQIYDQTLDRGNLALVRNRVQGIPVRVIRGHNHASPYSPPAGFSYDGLYRVEGHWSELGKSGYRIWRFRLRKIENDQTIRSFQVAEEKTEYSATSRLPVLISRIIRNTEVANLVKQLYNYHCQVCDTRIDTPGGPYAEAAHIRPLGTPHNGPDTADNILCLCPNCHVRFDMGSLTLENDLIITGTTQRLRVKSGHQINVGFVQYHREGFG